MTACSVFIFEYDVSLGALNQIFTTRLVHFGTFGFFLNRRNVTSSFKAIRNLVGDVSFALDWSPNSRSGKCTVIQQNNVVGDGFETHKQLFGLQIFSTF